MTEGGTERDGDRGRRKRKRRWKGEEAEEETGVAKNKMKGKTP